MAPAPPGVAMETVAKRETFAARFQRIAWPVSAALMTAAHESPALSPSARAFPRYDVSCPAPPPIYFQFPMRTKGAQ